MSAPASARADWAGRFDGKIGVITGAAQGIGRDAALRFVREGGRAVLVDRSELVHEVCAEAGGDAVAITADVEIYGECVRVMDEARNRLGRIDVLINNVGGTIWARPFAEYTEAQIEAEIRRSLFPTMWCCHAVLPAMLEHGKGAIVNVSSVATRGLNRVPYAAAKGGVNALTVCLAWEYADQGIRVNAVAPGGTEAPPRRIPRLAGPEESHPEQREREAAWWRTVVEQPRDRASWADTGLPPNKRPQYFFLRQTKPRM